MVTSILLIAGCAHEESLWSESIESDSSFGSLDADSGRGSSVEVPGGGVTNPSGLITAGEWNDLEDWDFWNELVENEGFTDKLPYWGFYHNNRISVKLVNNNQPVIDAEVSLIRSGEIIWTSKTDNKYH